MDDSGYAITPSPVVSNNNNDYYNRPQASPARPQSTNGYSADYEDYSYGSYQGRRSIQNHIQAHDECTSIARPF